MAYDLKDVKDIRKKFGLTQAELARRAGVSQSLIAKVESGRIDPTFTKAKQIFAVLDSLAQDKEMKAEEIMSKKIISAAPDETIGEVIARMRKHEISQLPVIDGEHLVGIVSEAIILDALMSKKKDSRIQEIMQNSPPIVSRKTSIAVISNLLKLCPMVMVAEKGKFEGIITKSDLIRSIYK